MNKWFVIDWSVARPFGHSPVTIACRPKPKEINCRIVKDPFAASHPKACRREPPSIAAPQTPSTALQAGRIFRRTPFIGVDRRRI
jgi:hypothetical protein